MTKERARKILQEVVSTGLLPHYDIVVYQSVDESIGQIEEYTFRELLCIVYNLEMKQHGRP